MQRAKRHLSRSINRESDFDGDDTDINREERSGQFSGREGIPNGSMGPSSGELVLRISLWQKILQ
jgi:hypothetical protein